MTTLIGQYILCTLTVWLHVPQLGDTFPHKGEFECLVIDDRFMSVGTPDNPRKPILVDCGVDRAYKMLEPNNEGVYMFDQGEQCEL